MSSKTLEKLSSKDRALLTLKALFANKGGMVARSYVAEKVETCIGHPFPEQMLDGVNRQTFDKLVEEVI